MVLLIIIIKLLFYIGITEVKAITEYNVTSDFRGVFPHVIDEKGNYYKIEKNSKHSIDITHHFNRGEFLHSFECTFRLDPAYVSRDTNFFLIHLYNSRKTLHLSINLNLDENLVKLAFKKNAIKTVYTFHFNNTVDFLDGEWHNIMYGIHNLKHEDSSIDCWIDCTKQSYNHLTRETFTEKDLSYFIKNVTLSIGELHGSHKNESVPIEISKMRFHGYPRMPIFARCEDIGKNVIQEESKIKLTKVHIYQTNNKTELHYDSDEEQSLSEESFESLSDSSSSIEDYSRHKEEVNPVSSIFGFILFVCFISVTAFLLKKYY
ncbi:uncharacterized protein LOC129613040 [Condylostylus longicornis]|uniref:uncharacterized protein LOC129613040 n=1 Tax=Condylostylus longicornis TaxID=2530218 RepID=UPI00244DB2D3|nr:uncharacterized protein LOC129613040 [Condylostylus longicornis]